MGWVGALGYTSSTLAMPELEASHVFLTVTSAAHHTWNESEEPNLAKHTKKWNVFSGYLVITTTGFF